MSLLQGCPHPSHLTFPHSHCSQYDRCLPLSGTWITATPTFCHPYLTLPTMCTKLQTTFSIGLELQKPWVQKDPNLWTIKVAVFGQACVKRAMRQRKPGSHTPPCHRRMVITTLFSVLLAALQRRPVLYHTRWLLTVHWLWSSGH